MGCIVSKMSAKVAPEFDNPGSEILDEPSIDSFRAKTMRETSGDGQDKPLTAEDEEEEMNEIEAGTYKGTRTTEENSSKKQQDARFVLGSPSRATIGRPSRTPKVIDSAKLEERKIHNALGSF